MRVEVRVTVRVGVEVRGQCYWWLYVGLSSPHIAYLCPSDTNVAFFLGHLGSTESALMSLTGFWTRLEAPEAARICNNIFWSLLYVF